MPYDKVKCLFFLQFIVQCSNIRMRATFKWTFKKFEVSIISMLLLNNSKVTRLENCFKIIALMNLELNIHIL